MTPFAIQRLSDTVEALAPDGSLVRPLLRLAGGSMARFELGVGRVSRAVAHRTVEEIWYVLGGRGEMWRSQSGREEIAALEAGVCLTIPAGTRFQFRAGSETLSVVAVTMPPWPGDDEATPVEGPWHAR